MNAILNKLLNVQDQIALCWLGNLSWLIRAQGKLLAIDLDLDRDNRIQPSPIPTTDLAPVLDIQFITHEHGDHFSDATSKILAEHSDCDFVLPKNCTDKAKKIGIPTNRITIAKPFQPFQIQGIDVEPRRALHGHTNFTVYRRANPEDCGYIFTLHDQKIYQPGDTVLLQEQLEDLNDVDILFVSPTLHNTHIAASTTLIETLRPNHIFPQHFGTYQPTDQNSYWTVGYPDELQAALSPDLQPRFHKLEQGEIFIV